MTTTLTESADTTIAPTITGDAPTTYSVPAYAQQTVGINVNPTVIDYPLSEGEIDGAAHAAGLLGWEHMAWLPTTDPKISGYAKPGTVGKVGKSSTAGSVEKWSEKVHTVIGYARLTAASDTGGIIAGVIRSQETGDYDIFVVRTLSTTQGRTPIS